MMDSRFVRGAVWCLLVALVAAGCDDAVQGTPPEAPLDGFTLPPDDEPDADGAPPDGDRPEDGGLPADGDLPADGAPTDRGRPVDAAPPDGGPCDPDPCGEGELCVAEGEPRCVAESCDVARCGPTEACAALDGGGFGCVDISCVDDTECPPAQHCDQICVDDVCAPGARICGAGGVEVCRANGSGFAPAEVCGGEAPGFESRCADDVDGAGCTCRDVWDCPPGMRCTGRRCRGALGGPTCRVDPLPFDGASVQPEAVWGAPIDAPLVGRPFPASSQVVMTPVVANLTDDNGDGRVDARDTPEIIFTTYCDSDYTANGALRVIRGAAPARGADLFAVLGPHHWRRGDPLPDPADARCADGDLDPNAGLAVGDLDDPATSDGRPEIVAIKERGGLVVFDAGGARIGEIGGDWQRDGNAPTPVIANVDGAGMAEIVVGPYVQTLRRAADGSIEGADRFEGRPAEGRNILGAIACVADLLGDGRLEVVAGATVYTLPSPPPGAARQSDCADLEPADESEAAWCAGELQVAWRAVDLEPELGPPFGDGLCAVADVWGAGDGPPGPDNPLDGAPEVIVVADGQVVVLDGATGRRRGAVVRIDRGGGGPPAVADTDGDGLPELVSGGGEVLQLVDWQAPTAACPEWPTALGYGIEPPGENPPRAPGGACADDGDCAAGARCADGACACLHTGWRRRIEDDSSRSTGLAAFDFDGDGRAEVVFNDECRLRVYDGGGAVRFSHPSSNRTRAEHAAIADVDGDGAAELVVPANDERAFCQQANDPVDPPLMGVARDHYNHGLEVWGDVDGRWVSARRIWNQHPYQATHVTEDGAVPLTAPPSWGVYGGRRVDGFRTQPGSNGAAPDLVVEALQVTAAEGGCDAAGEALTLWAKVVNVGDLRVGGEVVVGFEGVWGGARARLYGPGRRAADGGVGADAGPRPRGLGRRAVCRRRRSRRAGGPARGHRGHRRRRRAPGLRRGAGVPRRQQPAAGRAGGAGGAGRSAGHRGGGRSGALPDGGCAGHGAQRRRRRGRGGEAAPVCG